MILIMTCLKKSYLERDTQAFNGKAETENKRWKFRGLKFEGNFYRTKNEILNI
jgi:hypothetical protein